jgi:hypothetical protein
MAIEAERDLCKARGETRENEDAGVSQGEAEMRRKWMTAGRKRLRRAGLRSGQQASSKFTSPGPDRQG